MKRELGQFAEFIPSGLRRNQFWSKDVRIAREPLENSIYTGLLLILTMSYVEGVQTEKDEPEDTVEQDAVRLAMKKSLQVLWPECRGQ